MYEVEEGLQEVAGGCRIFWREDDMLLSEF
jgi:hypothetical protein